MKLLKSRNSVLVMLLVATLALGGMVGCASDSGSTTSTTSSGGADASSQSDSGGGCRGGSLEACEQKCDIRPENYYPCVEECKNACPE